MFFISANGNTESIAHFSDILQVFAYLHKMFKMSATFCRTFANMHDEVFHYILKSFFFDRGSSLDNEIHFSLNLQF